MGLINQLPEHYSKSIEVTAIQDGVRPVIDELNNNIDSLFEQAFINTATWAIDLWEKAFGIKSSEDNIEERRSRVMSKMRSGGTLSLSIFENILSSFYNGQVEIVEIPAESKFEVHFTSTVGTPRNIDTITQVINEIKPAHLAFEYVIVFVMHSEIQQYTHADLSSWTHDEIRNGGMS